MKIISFSLWGDKPMYTVGALENIALANEIYPDWTCRFYVDKTVTEEVKSNIKNEGGEIYFIDSDKGSFWGMFWRFMANDDPNMEVMISRDCDSRLSYREKAAVNEWLVSEKMFHTMHDHYAHRSVPILGGMWGVKRGLITNMVDKALLWGRYGNKGIDQDFLRDVIWKDVKDTTLSHSSINNRWNFSISFPKHKESKYNVKYVGEIFDENNKAVIS